MQADLIRSPKLQQGDLVRLVSPASYPDLAGVNHCIETLESWGLRCDTGNHILSQHGYMAGTDAERLDDLNKAFADPQVRAIVTTRGGAGAYRIADDIDFDAARSDPKPLLGFSDITSMHLSLLDRCQLGGVHGCLFGRSAQRSAKHLLMSTEPIRLNRNLATVSATVNVAGKAQGRLIGGNLQGMATAVGVRMPSLRGAIVFIEHHRRGLGTVDRYLTQLTRSGALDGIAGIALGSFECFRDFSDRGWNIADVLNDRLGALNVPVLGGIYAGHDLLCRRRDHDQYNIPLGSIATLDAGEGTLTVEPVVC